MFIEPKESPEIESVKDKNKVCCFDIFMAFILIIFILGNIAFLVISIMYFDYECKTYYILVFIYLGVILILFIFEIIWFRLEDTDDDYEENDHRMHFFPSFLCPIMIISAIAFGMEIAVLVFFIKSFSKLKLLSKIGYFIHISYFPLAMLLQLCKC